MDRRAISKSEMEARDAHLFVLLAAAEADETDAVARAALGVARKRIEARVTVRAIAASSDLARRV